MRQISKLLLAGTLAAAFGATTISAQEQNSQPGTGMMQGGMPMTGMMQQMSQMMDACTKMMQVRMDQPAPGAPGPESPKNQ